MKINIRMSAYVNIPEVDRLIVNGNRLKCSNSIVKFIDFNERIEGEDEVKREDIDATINLRGDVFSGINENVTFADIEFDISTNVTFENLDKIIIYLSDKNGKAETITISKDRIIDHDYSSKPFIMKIVYASVSYSDDLVILNP